MAHDMLAVGTRVGGTFMDRYKFSGTIVVSRSEGGHIKYKVKLDRPIDLRHKKLTTIEVIPSMDKILSLC